MSTITSPDCPDCGEPCGSGHQCPPKATEAQQLRERFTEMYAAYLPRITALVDSRIFNQADKHLTDDLTAEAFTRIWLSLHKCEATTDAGLFSWCARIAYCTVVDHFRVKRNTMERPVDLGEWQYANREMDSAAGYYTPAATGFRTAQLATGRPGDSDPDPDEALRRVRHGRQLAGAR